MSASADLVDLSAPRYDLSTYMGRLKHFYTVTSPLTLLVSSSTLQQAVAGVKKYDEMIKLSGGKGVWVAPQVREAYWKDLQLVQSSIHPDTQQPVPLAFRMSAFVPTNLIICAGMLTPNASLKQVIFWQWMNQTLNVAVNYSNANKSIEMSTSEIATAYTAATATSVLLAVSLTRLVPKIPSRIMTEANKLLLSKFVPFASVAGAGVVNITCIRWKEIRDGVTVFKVNTDPESKLETTEDIGKSSIAGAMAVGQSAASRVLTNVPTLIFPPVLMTAMAARGAFKGPRGKVLEMASQLTAIGLCLYLFLPPSIAVFPQRASIDASRLEKEKFSHIEGKLWFNKGL